MSQPIEGPLAGGEPPAADEVPAVADRPRRRSDELRASGEIGVLSLALDNPNGVVVVDADGRIMFANDSATAMLGRSSFDLVGSELGLPLRGVQGAEVELRRPGRRPGRASLDVVPLDWAGQPARLAVLRDTSTLRNAEREIDALLALCDHLDGSGGDAAGAPAVVFALCDLLDASFAQIWVPDDGGELIRPGSCWVARTTAAERFRAAYTEVRFRRGEGLVGAVWASGQARWVADLDADPDFVHRDTARGCGLRSALLLPGRWEGRPCVIEFLAPHGDEPGPRERRVIEAVVRQLGARAGGSRAATPPEGSADPGSPPGSAPAREAALRAARWLGGALTPPAVPATAGAHGSRTIAGADPGLFSECCRSYGEALDAAVASAAGGAGDPALAGRLLRRLTRRIIAAGGQPRDVIEIHVAAVREAVDGTDPDGAVAIIEAGAVLVLELMGQVAGDYRRRAMADVRPER